MILANRGRSRNATVPSARISKLRNEAGQLGEQGYRDGAEAALELTWPDLDAMPSERSKIYEMLQDNYDHTHGAIADHPIHGKVLERADDHDPKLITSIDVVDGTTGQPAPAPHFQQVWLMGVVAGIADVRAAIRGGTSRGETAGERTDEDGRPPGATAPA